MTKKVYRTAQGRIVDLGALQLQNENVRAVGNMSVNARGDLLDADNRPIATRNRQVASQYKKQTTNVSETKVDYKKNRAPQEVTNIPPPPEDFDDEFVREDNEAMPVTESVPSRASGLAAAIARAQEVKQEPMEKIRPRRPGTTRI